jgi:flagellar hook assembly protein FlgD
VAITPTPTATPTPTPTPGGTTGVTDTVFLPFKNVFNPMNEKLTVAFAAPGTDVSITVYDRAGNKLKELLRNGGQAVWDGRNTNGEIVASGSYLIVLKQGQKVQKKKVVVIK